MKENRKFKVKEELKDYIRNILARENVFHRFVKEGEQLYCVAALSGERFHKVVKRAYCEKMTEETEILHITFQESQNTSFCEALMKLFNKSSFVVVGEKK
jgi:hypothetical protein